MSANSCPYLRDLVRVLGDLADGRQVSRLDAMSAHLTLLDSFVRNGRCSVSLVVAEAALRAIVEREPVDRRPVDCGALRIAASEVAS